MLSKQEYLLTCLMEEAAEVSKAASKALRFGVWDTHPDTGEINRYRLEEELHDLIGVIEELNANGDITFIHYDPRVEQKREKLRKFLEFGRMQGKVE